MIQSNHLDCQSKASGAIRCLTMSPFTRNEYVPHPQPSTLHPKPQTLNPNPKPYRVTSLIKKRLPVGPWSSPMSRDLW